MALKKFVKKRLIALAKWLNSGTLPKAISEPVAFEGNLSADLRLVLGTNTGLMVYQHHGISRLFKGRVYGICKVGDRWYATWNQALKLFGIQLKTFGHIVSFRLQNNRVEDLKMELPWQDPELHQIDFWKGHLYITDTARNAVLKCRPAPKGLHLLQTFFPNGPLLKSSKRSNYAHINSVFHDGEKTYLVYHNQTSKTGRPSKIVEVNEKFEVKNEIEINGGNAHNVVVLDDGTQATCDSQNGRFLINDQAVFQRDLFLRGLACNAGRWIFGGSAFAKREERKLSTAYIFEMDRHTSQVLNEIRIPESGSLYEIRILDQKDLGLSK